MPHNKISAALVEHSRRFPRKHGRRFPMNEAVEGNSAELVLERKLYGAVAQLPWVKTICEIGFNAGHSV